jgi:hypothetical protein
MLHHLLNVFVQLANKREFKQTKILGGSHVATTYRALGWRRRLQIWKIATNILNKQSRTADKGWFSSLGFGEGMTSPRGKRINLA